jgi:hypothetical protein
LLVNRELLLQRAQLFFEAIDFVFYILLRASRNSQQSAEADCDESCLRFQFVFWVWLQDLRLSGWWMRFWLRPSGVPVGKKLLRVRETNLLLAFDLHDLAFVNDHLDGAEFDLFESFDDKLFAAQFSASVTFVFRFVNHNPLSCRAKLY